MQAAVNKRAYFGKTAPILLRPRLLNHNFNKKRGKCSWKHRKTRGSEVGNISVKLEKIQFSWKVLI